MEFHVRGGEGGTRGKEKRRGEGTRGRTEKRRKASLSLKERRERIRCVVSGQATALSPTHKVDKKEKDRAAMRLRFTPHRMTDPLSGASFNTLTDERTNVDYHRSCIAPRRCSPSLTLLSLLLSICSDARHCRPATPSCAVTPPSLSKCLAIDYPYVDKFAGGDH